MPQGDPDRLPQSTFFYWSVIDPLRIFYSYTSAGKTHVAAFDPLTGNETIIASAEGNLGSMVPPHPSEKWFLFGKKSERSVTPRTTISTLGSDGTLVQFDSEKPVHRLRFTTSPDRRIFYNQNGPRTSWTCLPDGAGRFEIVYLKRGTYLGHPGWTTDGKELTAYAQNKLLGFSYDGRSERVIAESVENGGHGTSCLDGIWFYSDGRDRLDAIKLDGSQTIVHLANPHTSFLNHQSDWHPKSHSTHAHPISSPDGTKLFFNSDALSQYTDIYVAVVRPPDPPLHLQARPVSGSTVLSWQRPFRNREIRGYIVYRAERSGLDYVRLTASPVAGLSWTPPREHHGGYYVVTAVEHSGLEGGPSNEVCGSGYSPALGPLCVTCEAESGAPSPPVREAIDPRHTSQGWFMRMPAAAAGGMLTLKVNTPRKADFLIWARIRGEGSVRIQCDARTAAVSGGGAADWTWRRLEAPMTTLAGEQTLVLSGANLDVDKILLTDDPLFAPKGTMALDTTPPPVPREFKTLAASPNAIRLSWAPLSEPNTDDIDHYHIYSSADAAFVIGEASLIRSPSECEAIDWGLPLNSVWYYRITAVDRFGNESPASHPVAGSVARFKPVSIRLTAETARVKGMKAEPIPPPAKAGATTRLSAVGQAGSASWTFEIPQDGEYAVWVLSTHQPEAGPAILEVNLDDNAISTQVQTRGPWTAWNWSPAGSQVTGSPQRFSIKAGSHVLRLGARSDSANFAQVMISDDPSWDPIEGMSQFANRP